MSSPAPVTARVHTPPQMTTITISQDGRRERPGHVPTISGEGGWGGWGGRVHDARKPLYIFGYHPHGIISWGALVCFATEGADFSANFPGIDLRLLTLKVSADRVRESWIGQRRGSPGGLQGVSRGSPGGLQG
eukprot:446358-Prorocentrum_minimum.AAC.1